MLLSALNVIVYALIVIIAIILVVLILIQPSKGGGLGSAFGGAGENVFGAHAMDHASKLTVWLIAIFFTLTLALTVISAHSSPGSVMDNVESTDANTVKTEEKKQDVMSVDAQDPDMAQPTLEVQAPEVKAPEVKAPEVKAGDVKK